MNKQYELKKSKNIALLFLAIVSAVFIGTLFLPGGFWPDLIKAVSEAAMVGALADWFAVHALFKRVPIPLLSHHTAIIPRNKDKIADNLAIFVKDKFFDVDSIAGLIRKHDPANLLSAWLIAPGNTENFGRHLLTVAARMLDFIEDAPVQRFMTRALHVALAKVDLSQSAGVILGHLTKDGRHQALLDEALMQCADLLANQDTQDLIASEIVIWLKQDHPLKEKVLPSEWIGRQGADIAVNAVSHLLAEINANKEHPLRNRFDDFTERFIEQLKDDPDFIAKGEQIKTYLLNDPTLNIYLKDLWGSLRAWLKDDLARNDSLLHQNIVAAGLWLGKTLAEDPALRRSVNAHLEDAAKNMAPDFADFLTRHISDTVKNWDSKEMAKQIELNIGKDLQWIRINGTIVGGLIGLLLYLISQLRQWMPHV
ncbi:putative membrane protein [Collimonas arenae]|uniref:Putative membrane protein n=1 Tax=Collimonas arenae TaxID=279058 RepID=A0A0A1FFB7_9BURK|nr:DUF445 family protein [Collimonas arenae]AIY41547.1 putative membrane protein [Collimonas arenae]